MKRPLLSALAVFALAPVAYGQGATVSETIALRNILARDVPTSVKSASGLDQLTCDFHANSVTARGSQDAVAAFEKELQAADRPRTQYRMALRLVRCHVDQQGKYAESVDEAPTITDTDNVPAVVSFTVPGHDGYALTVTPQGSAAGQVSLTVQVQELGEQGEVMSEGKNARLVPLGKTARITGMTEAADKPLRRAVQRGEIVTDRGEYTGCYVEVTPTLAAPPDSLHP